MVYLAAMYLRSECSFSVVIVAAAVVGFVGLTFLVRSSSGHPPSGSVSWRGLSTAASSASLLAAHFCPIYWHSLRFRSPAASSPQPLPSASVQLLRTGSKRGREKKKKNVVKIWTVVRERVKLNQCNHRKRKVVNVHCNYSLNKLFNRLPTVQISCGFSSKVHIFGNVSPASERNTELAQKQPSSEFSPL